LSKEERLFIKKPFMEVLICIGARIIGLSTGYDEKKLQERIDEKVTFEKFFQQASLHPNAKLITGVICGYRVEDIENPLTQQVRYLDKLIDELAKGRKMDKILREA
jgi:hypothetical protein